MPLTSNQKHYIKKKAGKLSAEQIAGDLNLPEREVVKYLKKSVSSEKFRKIMKIEREPEEELSASIENFNFKNFIKANIGAFVFLLILVLVCYFNGWKNDFTSDDIGNIKNNPLLEDTSYVFSQIIGTTQRILYLFISKLFGVSAPYFRTLNILVHLFNTFALFILLNMLTRRSVALFAASLFAVHPILVESITWISGFPYAFYSFFIILAFIAYLKERRTTALVLFLLALISSEKAIVFPGILFIFELSRSTLKANWKKTTPFFVVDMFFIIFYLLRIGKRVTDISTVSYQDSSGLYNPFIQIPTAIANYFKLIVWPQKLTLYQTEMNFSPLQFFLIVIVFLVFLGIIFQAWKKNRILFFWLSFFIVALLPVLTPLKVAWVVAERYVYLGSIGVFVGIAFLFDWLMQKAEENDERYKIAVYLVFMLIIAALSARTITRNIDWTNEDHLWPATAKVASSGPNIHNNMGDVYARHGELEKAAEEFRKALEINPNYGDAYHNLANTYTSMGKIDLAIENYKKALSINPNIWQSHQNLAGLYYNLGDYRNAYESIKKAAQINPNDLNLQKNLAEVESKLNQPQQK